jgi:hypothetical protein
LQSVRLRWREPGSRASSHAPGAAPEVVRATTARRTPNLRLRVDVGYCSTSALKRANAAAARSCCPSVAVSPASRACANRLCLLGSSHRDSMTLRQSHRGIHRRGDSSTMLPWCVLTGPSDGSGGRAPAASDLRVRVPPR